MSVRASLLLGLVLAVTGCLSDDGKLPTVSSGSLFGTPSVSLKQAPPATQEVSQRVLRVGQKVVAANPAIKQKIAFLTVGVPQEEIFHQTNKDVSTIWITEGLANQCKSDGELAAVLSQELGKIVSERMAVQPPRRGWPNRQLMMNPHVGNDNVTNGTFGTTDFTDQLTAYHAEKEWLPSSLPAPPPPESLARAYLTSAGFDAKELTAVAALLRKAGKNTSLEQSMTVK
jgi:hypothetical protein